MGKQVTIVGLRIYLDCYPLELIIIMVQLYFASDVLTGSTQSPLWQSIKNTAANMKQYVLKCLKKTKMGIILIFALKIITEA